MNNQTQVAVFGGGCFWCTEAVFSELKGVMSVKPGYAGGETSDPTYEEVSMGKTNHAEVIRIEYDPTQISYHNLLTVFFSTHDSTTPNRQGADVGTQYRSVIFYTTEEQNRETQDFIAELNEAEPKVVTEVKSLPAFYEAENYHRQYYAKNRQAPYCQIVINPKIEKLKTKFNNLLKS